MDKPNNDFIKKIHTEKWTFDKEKIDILKKHAKNFGESLDDFLNRAIEETLKRDKEKEIIRAIKDGKVKPVWNKEEHLG